jgi:endonuclease/exonuclease/phosphatase family metal-dependent hydrolase
MLRSAVWLAVLLALGACSTFKNYEAPEGPRYAGAYAAGLPSFDGTVKVISYNIKYGIKVEQAISDLTDIAELADGDILLLQELDPAGADMIARRLHANYVYYPASVQPATGKDFGNAVLSRWPIQGSRKVLLPHARPIRRQKRIAVFAEVRVGGLTVLACSAHTETVWMTSQGRRDQMVAITESIPDDAAYVVVGGDFNTQTIDSVHAAEKVFQRAGLNKVTRGIGPTVRGEPTGLITPQQDHVFARGMTCLARGKSREAKASDHYPIWARLSPAAATTLRGN